MPDVVVVGAGPVGSFLTLALLDAGIDAVAVEQRMQQARRSRAIGIHPGSLALFERYGLTEPLIGAGVSVDHGVAKMRGSTIVSLELRDRASGYPVLALPQWQSEQLIGAALERVRPDAIRRGITVDALTRRGDRLVLGGTRAGERWSADARFVIGADGPRSRMRTLSGAVVRRRSYRERYAMGDFADGTRDGSSAVLHLEPGGVVESFPLPGGTRRWVLYLNGEEPSDATELAAALEARTGIPIDAGSASMFSSFSPARSIVTAMAGESVALIGDAAHEISPIGGQGMNLGWADAAAVAALLPRVLAGQAGRAELADFSRRRLAIARTAAAQAEINMALGHPSGPISQAAKRMLAGIAAAAPVGRMLAERFTMVSLERRR